MWSYIDGSTVAISKLRNKLDKLSKHKINLIFGSVITKQIPSLVSELVLSTLRNFGYASLIKRK